MNNVRLLLYSLVFFIIIGVSPPEHKSIIKSRVFSGAVIPTDVYECLQSGDLILEAGNTLLSHTIIRLLNEPRPFSHVGMLVWEQGSWQVLHTLSRDISEIDGLRFEPLTAFLKGAQPHSLLVVRPNGGDQKRLVAEAYALLAQGIPFDRYFDLMDSSAFYCTEFIYHAMQRSGYPAWVPDTLPNGSLYLGFRHLYNTSHTEVIYDSLEGK